MSLKAETEHLTQAQINARLLELSNKFGNPRDIPLDQIESLGQTWVSLLGVRTLVPVELSKLTPVELEQRAEELGRQTFIQVGNKWVLHDQSDRDIVITERVGKDVKFKDIRLEKRKLYSVFGNKDKP